jgi:two-component system CheB/CheR fusion protein
MAFEAYLGMPLKNANGNVVGIISVLYCQPQAEPQNAELLLKVFASRASSELDRMKAQAALDRSELEWTYAMDSFEDPIYLLDLDDRVMRANKAFYQLTGLVPESVIGRDISSIMHPDGEASPCPVCEARTARRDVYITQEADNPHNGSNRPRELMIRTIRDEQNKPVGVLMAIHDLTRARQTEEAFRRLNHNIRLLMESTGEGIFGVDSEARCTFINRSAADMLGYQPEEIQGRDTHALLHHSYEDGSEYPRDHCRIIRTIDEACSFIANDEVLWRKDGSCFPVQYSCNPIIENECCQGAVVVFRNVSEARAMAQRLDYLATHDALTGLVNRHEFERRLVQALGKGKKKRIQHVLCYLDLDQFKVVNDTCGHVAGDELLHQLSGLLLDKIRHGDTLARLGGDEFGVLLERCSIHQALRIVKDLQETVREFRFVWEDKTFSIGVSIGVVPLTSDTETPATAMSAADAACYLAKDSGRNRIHVYQTDDAELARRHGEMQWVTRIQKALEQNRFLLHAQPIESIAYPDGGGEYFEILIRMKDHEGKLVPPGAFLPAAERYNLTPAIDRWVIEKTFAWLAAHPAVQQLLNFCTINLSGHSLSDDSFLDFVTTQLEEKNIVPGKVCFEITETTAVANLTHATRLIRELKSRGCLFALDDFGSGMSSFAYLKNLPVDYLKIDGNFVKDIAVDPVDLAMVEAINKVGHVMGIQTIAEFVENDAIMARLKNVGVDFVQGFGIARPQQLDDRYLAVH